MKVLAGVSADATTWIRSDRGLSESRMILKELKKVLMLSGSNKHDLVKSLEGSLLSADVVSILSSIIQDAPMALTGNLDFAQFAIGQPGPFEVLDFDLALRIDALAGSTNLEFKEGTSKTEAYQASFGRFARYAREISILDPYAGHTVLSDRKTAPWLLNQLLEEGCQQFTFATTLPSSADLKAVHEPVWKRKKMVVDGVKELVRKSASPNAQVDFQIFFADPKIFHNRRIKFVFDSGSVAYVLEKGIAGFGAENMEPEDTLSEINPASFDRKLQAIQEKLTRVR